jgi:hypothetical protein
MPDPSDVFFVRGAIQLLEREMNAPTRTIFFSTGASGFQSWHADANYWVVGCTSNSTSTCVLSLDQSPTTLATAVDKVTAGAGLIAVLTGFAGSYFGLNFQISKNDRIWLAAAASGQFVNVFLMARS